LFNSRFSLIKPQLFLTLSLVAALASHAAESIPAPDPENGGLALPPGFPPPVVANHLVAGRRAGKSAECPRGTAAAPHGNIYAKPVRILHCVQHDKRV